MTPPRPPSPPSGAPGGAGDGGLAPSPALPVLVAVIAALGAAVFPFDARVMDAVRELHGHAHPVWSAWRRAVPVLLFFANGGFLIPAALAAWAVGRLRGAATLRRTGRALFLALVAGGLAAQALKHLFGRVRPNFGGLGEFTGPNLSHGPDSFPSGHATDAFTVAWVLTRLHPRLGWAAWPFALLVGFQRVEGLKHFPADIAAGAALGLVVSELVLRRQSGRR